jgi:hypothetical protein
MISWMAHGYVLAITEKKRGKAICPVVEDYLCGSGCGSEKEYNPQ